MSNDTPHIAILGAGFAALSAVRELRRRLPQAKISLLAPSAEFVYLPSLIWIPPGIRQGSDLIIPLRKFIEKHRVDYRQCTVQGLANGGGHGLGAPGKNEKNTPKSQTRAARVL